MKLKRTTRGFGGNLLISVALICLLLIPGSKQTVTVPLKNCRITMQCYEPVGFHQILVDSEGEHFARIYPFSNGAYVILFQGALNRFSEDSMTPKKTVKTGDVESKWGYYDNGKVWRIDRHGRNVKVYYCNCPVRDRKTFDKMLDSITVEYISSHPSSEDQADQTRSE